MPLIIPANSITGGYEVDNSLRFNDGSSDNLSRNTWGTATSDKIFTISVWVKRTTLGATQQIVNSYDGSTGNDNQLKFKNTDAIELTVSTSGAEYFLKTNRLFRDVSAWYHIVFAFDSTQGTDTNRYKLYVNGTQETSFSSVSYPPQNTTYQFFNNSNANRIGIAHGGSSEPFDGYMAEVCFIDGQQLDPTSFGEFDEDSGIWKPIDVSGLTFGTNGFYLDFENSGSLGADVSGNGNNFTVNNLTSIDQTTDTPTNNYCTMNPLFNPDPSNPLGSISNGNLSFTTNSTSLSSMGVTTFGASSGKYYAEIKLTGESGSGEAFAGIGYDIYENATSSFNAESSFMWNVCSNGDAKFGGSAQGVGNWSNTYTTNDIISIALDLDNNRVYFAKNGQYADGSGNWDESFTGSPAYATITADKSYFFCAGDKSSSQTASWSCNFGNPPYTISSGNSDGNGMGNFEYSVPSGYYALNTKNLAEYG
jgi:hypothetical protein